MKAARLAAVLVVLGALVLAQRFGVFHLFADPVSFKRSLLELGGWGYVAFVLSYATLQPFGVPGTMFILAAPLIWSWPVAFVLSMTGTMAASVVGFSFARFLARDWVSSRIPARFQRYNEALAQRGFGTVFAMRLFFWMPPPLHAFFGISQVPFWTHFWGSLCGYILPLLLVSYFGQRFFDAMKGAPPTVWIGLAVGIGLVLLTVRWRQRVRSRRELAGSG